MKSCGKRFHDEVGKFRFLNELIKVVSPKVRPSTGSVPALMEACRRKVSRGRPVRKPAQILLQNLTESGQPGPLRNQSVCRES